MNGLSLPRPMTGLVALLILPLSGCLAVAAGAAGYGVYTASDGRVSSTSGSSLDRTYAAALAAAPDLGLNVTQKYRDSHSAHIEALAQDRTPVTIDLAKRSAGMTRIDIRCGPLGDEAASKRIINSIKARL